MNEFTFEETPWERTLDTLTDSISAVRFLTLLEGEDEDAAEDALLDLEERKIHLDLSGLAAGDFTGEAAERLHREDQLVKQGQLLQNLEGSDPLRLYLEELAQIPPLAGAEALAAQAARGDEGARNRLVNGSLGRVVEIARELTGHGVLLLDLIQEGSMGLWQGVLRYTGGDFAAHRDWWIRQYMAKAIVLQARSNGTGQKMRRALEDYRSTDEKLLMELGRNPTLEEIAEALHMTQEEAQTVSDVLKTARMLDQTKPPQEQPVPTDEEEQAVEDTSYFQMRQRIQELLSVLPEDEVRLLTLRFGLEGGLPLSPEETGRKLDLTADEVVAREAAALAKLRGT